MYKILILGADGFLGRRLINVKSSNFVSYGTTRNVNFLKNSHLVYFDANEFLSLSTLLKRIKPDIVINCIALKVEECEINEVDAKKINVLFPQYAAKITGEFGIKFIQISTDNFESIPGEIRNEKVICHPVNAYGRSKIMADYFISVENKDAIIIRTSFFGYEMNSKADNLLSKIRDSALSNVPFNGFYDVYFSPVSISYLVYAIQRLFLLNFSGLINVSSDETITQYEFALIVSRHLNLATNAIQRCSVLELNSKLRRVSFRSLNNSLLKTVLSESVPSVNDMIRVELGSYS